jgi:hypothetical protein
MTNQEINQLCGAHIATKGKNYLAGVYLQYAIDILGCSTKKAETFALEIQKPNPDKAFRRYHKPLEKQHFYNWYYGHFMTQYFFNGFESWYHAHHYITSYTNKYQKRNSNCVVTQTYQQEGTRGVIQLAAQWTTEFELRHRLVNWNRKSYVIAIMRFCNEKNFKS